MAKVTYLLGAGASANTIPIVNNMVYRFEEVIGYLKQIISRFRSPQDYDHLSNILKGNISYVYEVIDDLTWLKNEAFKYQTIDTLAKKYYLTGNDDLVKLKKTLVTYFTLEQLLMIPNYDSNPLTSKGYNFIKKKELRYDSFFAAILDKVENELVVNPDVKILTWNYDQQIELALKTFYSKEIHNIKQSLQIYPNQVTFDKTSHEIDLNRFGVVKINGNAIWSNKNSLEDGDEINSSCYDHYDKDQNDHKLGYIFQEYALARTMNNGISINESLKYFNFSWESDTAFENKYQGFYNNTENACKIASETEILVVIGYSFPIFNRKTDTEIISKMVNLKKIYIQDPSAENIKSTMVNGFKIIMQKKKGLELPFQLETSTNQFIIPFEL